MTLRVVTVKASGGDYSSLNAAGVGEAANLVALDRQLRIDCYPMIDTTAAAFVGYTTDATRYITVKAIVDHGGVWNQAAYILTTSVATITLQISANYTLVDGLQVEGGVAGGIAFYQDSASGVGIQERNCLAKISASAVGFQCNSNAFLANCLAFGASGATPTRGFFGAGTGPIYFLNCTAVGTFSVSAFVSGAANKITAINCLAQSGAGASFSGTFNASSSNNVASGPSAPGANSRTSQTASFRSVTAGSEDYHLASGDTAAKGYGTNLSAFSAYPFDTDIDGTRRTGTWDVGFDQYVAPTGWTLNDLAPVPVTESFAAPATAFSQRADVAPLAMLLEAPTTAITITGTVSTATVPETSTLSSREVVTGASASANAAESSAATGTERLIGAASTATAPETSTLASREVVTGAIASADSPGTSSQTGLERLTGTTSTGTAPETSALASSEVITGSLSSADAAETSSLAAAETFSGALATGTAPETTALASAEVITGTIGSAGAPEPTAATGGQAFAGTIGTATPAETSALASVEVITGSGDSADAAQSSALTAEEAFVGAVGTATAAETSALASSEVTSGAVTSATPAESSALTGVEIVVGALGSDTPAETTTLASTEVVTGSIGSATDAASSEVTGAVTVVEDGVVAGSVGTADAGQTSDLRGAVTSDVVVPPVIAPPSGITFAPASLRERVAGAIATAQAPQSSTLNGAVTDLGSVPAVATPAQARSPVAIGDVDTAGAAQTMSALGVVSIPGAIATSSAPQTTIATGEQAMAGALAPESGAQPTDLAGELSVPLFGAEWSPEEDAAILAAAFSMLDELEVV